MTVRDMPQAKIRPLSDDSHLKPYILALSQETGRMGVGWVGHSLPNEVIGGITVICPHSSGPFGLAVMGEDSLTEHFAHFSRLIE